jgi:hypothetical protein
MLFYKNLGKNNLVIKLQITSTKKQINSNIKTSNVHFVFDLEPGFYLLFEICKLIKGAISR